MNIAGYVDSAIDPSTTGSSTTCRDQHLLLLPHRDADQRARRERVPSHRRRGRRSWAGPPAEVTGQRRSQAQLTAAINRHLTHRDGTYIDGIDGTGAKLTSASQYANACALAYGVVPASRRATWRSYVAGWGWTCPVSSATDVLKGLADNGRIDDVVRILTDPVHRRVGQHPGPRGHLHVGGVGALRCRRRQHVARLGIERPRRDPTDSAGGAAHEPRVRVVRRHPSRHRPRPGRGGRCRHRGAPSTWPGGGLLGRRASSSSTSPSPPTRRPPWPSRRADPHDVTEGGRSSPGAPGVRVLAHRAGAGSPSGWAPVATSSAPPRTHSDARPLPDRRAGRVGPAGWGRCRRPPTQPETTTSSRSRRSPGRGPTTTPTRTSKPTWRCTAGVDPLVTIRTLSEQRGCARGGPRALRPGQVRHRGERRVAGARPGHGQPLVGTHRARRARRIGPRPGSTPTEQLRQMIQWLRLPLEDPSIYPEQG